MTSSCATRIGPVSMIVASSELLEQIVGDD